MTPPSAAAPSGADANGGVGYTYQPRSYSGPELTPTARRPGIAPGAPAGAERCSASTVSRETGETHADYERRRRREDPAYAERQRQLSLAAKRRRRGVCEVCVDGRDA